jgi:hypothetical protein
MRENRAKYSLKKTQTALKQKSTFSSMNRHAYTTQYCFLALAFTRAGCTQSRIGGLLTWVGKVLGVKVKHSMSRRTVGCVITEGGIKVHIQLAHKLAHAKGRHWHCIVIRSSPYHLHCSHVFHGSEFYPGGCRYSSRGS